MWIVFLNNDIQAEGAGKDYQMRVDPTKDFPTFTVTPTEADKCVVHCIGETKSDRMWGATPLGNVWKKHFTYTSGVWVEDA